MMRNSFLLALVLMLTCPPKPLAKADALARSNRGLTRGRVKQVAAATAPRNYPEAAMTFSSIAMGVGNAVTSIVVRVGFGLACPAKYSA